MIKKLIFCLTLVISLCSILLAQNIPTGFTKVKVLGGIEEYTLDSNQLAVLLMEDHSAPVLTFMVTYRVGSRNEVTGATGATHLLEHLMFKGTPTFNKESGTQIAAILQNIGALMNATTWLDRTNYFENIPSDQLELAVHLESDRMRNSMLREQDRQSEMTVVRNEFERGENSPLQALDQLITATAIQAHPYHHSTIGWRSDIENVPIRKLKDFYDTFYWPNNATAVVIGDFDKKNALSLIKKYFGVMPASPHEIPTVYTTEPEQQGPRRVVVKRAGQVGVVGIAHKVPEGTHEDTYALSVLNNILAEGKTSLLYKALIDKSLAVNVFVSYFPFHDPSLFIPYAFLAPEVKHEEVEKVILGVYEKIRNEGVSQAEVTRAINQIAAETAYDRDGSFSIARQLNEAIAMGDWTFFVTYLDNIRKVTPQDVQEVVNKYFVEDQSTTGYFIPKLPGGEEQSSTSGSWIPEEPFLYYRHPILSLSSIPSPNTNELSLVSFDYEPIPPATDSGSRQIERVNVDGIDVINVKTGVKDVVTFTGSLAAGDALSPRDNLMVADMTGNLLDKGTANEGKFELAEKLENLGATISFSVDTHSLTFSGQCLKKDVTAVIDLLAEQLRYPAFSEEELEKLKKQREGNFKQLMENTNVRASRAMSRMIFPESHPNYQPHLDRLIEDTKKVTVNDIRDFHKTHYGPQSMVFVAVGDLESKKVQDSIQKAFNGWEGGVGYPTYPKAAVTGEMTKKVVRMDDKTSATLRVAQVSTLRRTDRDYLPLMVGNYIFGGNFSARLMSIIRDDEGLTYGIRSGLEGDIFSDGTWFIQGTFAPDLLQKGINSTMRELNRWVDDGVSAEELNNKKTTLIGSYKVRLATTTGMANQILSFVQRGYDVDYLDQYPKEVEALTLEQVNSAVRKYIAPAKVATVIAGTVDENGMPLETTKGE